MLVQDWLTPGALTVSPRSVSIFASLSLSALFSLHLSALPSCVWISRRSPGDGKVAAAAEVLPEAPGKRKSLHPELR